MAKKKQTSLALREGPKVRGKAEPREGRERKDRVLQARVPKTLYNDLVAQALRLRVPVSNLVRNILEDSVRMVGNIVVGGIEIAEALGGKADESDLASVIGWQPMIANRGLTCSRCGKGISKGGEAFMSIGAPSGRGIVICEECKCEV